MNWHGLAAESVTEVKPHGVRSQRPREADYARAGAGETSVFYTQFGPRLQIAAAIHGEDRLYRLRGTFVVRLRYLADGTVFASHKELPVHGYGESAGEALSAFDERFDAQWRNLVEAPVDILTPHARGLRGLLEAAVDEVLQLG